MSTLAVATGGDHAKRAARFNRDPARVGWHDETLWMVRQKRDRMARQIPDWEPLRESASQIKHHTLSRLHEYLLQFETAAQANGATVHWAADADEHNRIVHSIIARHGADTAVIKSKSMLTEECQLNVHLRRHGYEVIDTDLGERIVQLANQSPSHIVLPCIHMKKEEIGELFHGKLGTPKGNSDPPLLAQAARASLRENFLAAQVAITGVNFAVAETGEVVVCTNEGNADLGVQLADVHIACMGIEKLIPRREHLGVFLRLLARSATGQPITTYSSHFRRPRPRQEMHIVLVDNGRAARLASDDFRSALKCIRCGACMNTCPVYRRSGGHSYHTAIAGPIGSILAPALDMKKYGDLPFASTLCGSCSHVCPVKIDIHDQLYKWRQVVAAAGHVGVAKGLSMHVLNFVLARPRLYRLAGSAARIAMRYAPFMVKHRLNPWYRQRELPPPPAQSFGEWYGQHRRRDGQP